MLSKEKQELVDEVIDNFDFKIVHGVMTVMNWEWIRNGQKSVPTIEELKAEATFLLEQSIINNMSYTCGGLLSSYKEGVLGLKFVLESYYTYS